MAEFASNCPISRPVNTGWKVDWDMNGMAWSHDWGIFYQPEDDLVPLRKPAPRTGT